MARRRAQPVVDQSNFAARDLSDDFRARDTADDLDPLYDETPSGSAEPIEPVDGGAPPARNARLAAMPPVTRAVFTAMARLAKSITEGSSAVESRPIPPEQRSRGVVLVVQILPDGRRVVFR